MDYNPFVVELHAADDAITAMEAQRAALVEQVSWASLFNQEDEAKALARLRAELDEQNAELRRVEQELLDLASSARELDSRTPALERDARVDFRILVRWLNDEHDRAKALLKKHRQEVAAVRVLIKDTEAKRNQANGTITELAEVIQATSRAIASFAEFSRTDADNEIARIDDELIDRRMQRDYLKKRTADVEDAVAGPLAEFHRYESEIRAHEAEISSLKSEVTDLDDQIAKVDKIKKKLSEATTGKERWELHDECERKFGEGKPGLVLHDLRGKKRPLQDDVRDRERQLNRLRRDKEKSEKRIANLAGVAAREVRVLVIDGNNSCFEGKAFIGLAALIPMTEDLARKYPVTVVFDASIRRKLRASDGDITAALSHAKVHVVATKTEADETILDISDDPGTWVISNDRYGEFGDKSPVAESRIIRHEIVAGRVLVHDLSVNEPLAKQGQPST